MKSNGLIKEQQALRRSPTTTRHAVEGLLAECFHLFGPRFLSFDTRPVGLRIAQRHHHNLAWNTLIAKAVFVVIWKIRIASRSQYLVLNHHGRRFAEH